MGEARPPQSLVDLSPRHSLQTFFRICCLCSGKAPKLLSTFSWLCDSGPVMPPLWYSPVRWEDNRISWGSDTSHASGTPQYTSLWIPQGPQQLVSQSLNSEGQIGPFHRLATPTPQTQDDIYVPWSLLQSPILQVEHCLESQIWAIGWQLCLALGLGGGPGRAVGERVAHALCGLSTSLCTVIPPVPGCVLPPSHTCWQSALTCVVPVCTKAWLERSWGIYFCLIHTYLVCRQTGAVFMSQFSFAKGKKYSGAINVYILNSRPHALCI